MKFANADGSYRCARYVMAALSVSITMLLCASGAVYAAEGVDKKEKAVWQVKELSLQYMGFTTIYSCDGLRDRVRDVLDELGLKETSSVSLGACADLSGPTKHPGVRIVVAYPVPATDENLQAIAADPERAKLVAQLKKRTKSAIEFGAEPFDAERTRVMLSSKKRSPGAGAGDCELLEQLRDRVIKPLGGMVIKDSLSCTPYQASVGDSRLTVELLSAVRS